MQNAEALLKDYSTYEFLLTLACFGVKFLFVYAQDLLLVCVGCSFDWSWWLH